MSNIVAVPIIKVIDDNMQVKILLENGKLPTIPINTYTDDQILTQVSDSLFSEYEIKSQWIEIYFVGMCIADDCLRIYYSSFVPESFLNEKVSAKMSSEYSKLPIQDGEQIQRSFSILPY
jgi:hypothetical protein